MGKEVIILAGGLGTRLRSIVNDVPKCMAPVAGKPFLWYLLKYLSHFDVERVILSVGYLREIIIDWVNGNYNNFPFSFDYAIETTPLGTGGGIKLALSKCLNDNVIILNGDTFFNVDLNELYNQHLLYSSSITLALKPMEYFDRYGNVRINNNLIINFEEKKHCARGLINGGVYVINRLSNIFNGLSGKFSFETDVLQPLCIKQIIHGITQNGYFIDIGIPEDYTKANTELPQVLSLFK